VPGATMVGSMAGSAAATLALAAVRGPVLTIVTAGVTGLVTELYRPAVSAFLAVVPGPRRVKAFGVYQLGVSAGATAGPATGGLIAEHSFLLVFAGDAGRGAGADSNPLRTMSASGSTSEAVVRTLTLAVNIQKQ
jgi:MFS family permease